MRSARFPFNDEFIEAVVPDNGVYALWENNVVIFYGIADKPGHLREKLISHKTGKSPGCAKHISHFQVEPASRIMTLRERLEDLLRDHMLTTRSYPRWNLPARLMACRETFPNPRAG